MKAFPFFTPEALREQEIIQCRIAKARQKGELEAEAEWISGLRKCDMRGENDSTRIAKRTSK